MIKRLILILAVILGFYVDYLAVSDGFDIWLLIALLIVTGFQMGTLIYVYKDYIGWNNFENPEGFNLKRKK